AISITVHPTLHISAELQKQTIWQLTLLTKGMKINQDEGAWNDAMAGSTCLGLVARIVGDDIVPLVKKNRPSTEFQKLKASETPNKLDNKC
ncbi:importin subunit beta-1-like protein, partial [Tanacetum coccineum]